MLVKACGLRSLEEISWAHELGFDFWGIVLEPQSKRYVAPDQLQALWQTMPEEWRGRCVLVARKWQGLALAARFCTAALLQCYDGFPHYIAANRRFMPVSSEEQWQLCRSGLAYGIYDVSMGSGLWCGLPEWCRNQARLFVAGGLDQNRLQQLARQERGSRFFGFDLSSGLENDQTGCKDYRKMEACIGLIRNHFLDILR